METSQNQSSDQVPDYIQSIEMPSQNQEETKRDPSPTQSLQEAMQNLELDSRADDPSLAITEGTNNEMTVDNMSEVQTDKKPATQKRKPKKPVVQNNDAVSTRTRSRFAHLKAQSVQIRKQKVGVVYDDQMILHRQHREYHPERPERIMAVYLNLVKKNLYKELVEIDCEFVEDEHVKLAHGAQHLVNVQKAGNKKNSDKLLDYRKNCHDIDTYTNRFTAQAASLAAGGSVEAVRAVMMGTVDNAFAIVRPPGHHAHSSKACGFCFYNNVAVAARVAQKELGVGKVAIFDWDVHVGDGTAQIFYEDPSVLYMSIHRFDNGSFYPGPMGKHERAGDGKGRGYNIHFPFNVQKNQSEQIGDKDFIYACEQVFFPILKEFKPELLIISAGFDSAKGDPLGGIAVTPVGYSYMTQGLRSLTKKIAVVLEGGYSVEALEVSSEAVIRTLQIDPKDKAGIDELLGELSGDTNITYSQLETQSQINPRQSFKQIACNVAKTHKKQWPCLSHLIFEKPRRKSSNTSNNSSGSGSGSQKSHGGITPRDFNRTISQDADDTQGPNTADLALENMRKRANSTLDVEPIEESKELD